MDDLPRKPCEVAQIGRRDTLSRALVIAVTERRGRGQG
jgi:hypothetical protein